MICEICKDEFFLRLPSREATAEDMDIARNLLDTLEAHSDGCVGMAANMIGVSKRIIAFDCEGTYMVMFNPVIVKKGGGLSGGGGLPVFERHPANRALPVHQGAVAERKISNQSKNLYRLDSADYPA